MGYYKHVGIKSAAWIMKNIEIEYFDASSQQFDLLVK